ncbi:hypothetical protein Pcinc_004157 [Petrolisthes cinctipes]|uniref:Uncharacterized protein n=1 Tax=Petrolisthes cinctipes TaxID=88211 RepID=A0AAE1L3Y9_PETCI|nr:hypothetical protein Pcinc_004157 [Petrolisthes cinctipes]
MGDSQPKPGDSCDSPGSVALQYDQPANLRFDDTIPGYACTQHSWVLDQYSQGLTDCHFVLDYEIDFYDMDISYNGPGSYYEAFKHCESVDCVGLVCRKDGSVLPALPDHSLHLSVLPALPDHSLHLSVFPALLDHSLLL